MQQKRKLKRNDKQSEKRKRRERGKIDRRKGSLFSANATAIGRFECLMVFSLERWLDNPWLATIIRNPAEEKIKSGVESELKRS